MGIFTWFKVGAFIILAAIIAGAWQYFKWSQEEMKVQAANSAKLEQALETSNQAIEDLQLSVAEAQSAMTQVNEDFKKLRTEYQSLSDKLARHDIGYLASQKPGLMESRFNKGTDDVGRCFELATGAKRSVQEREATKRSQINGSCPGLANPNYEAAQ